MKKTFCMAAAMFLSVLTSQAAYHGHVFVDTNENGQHDNSEKMMSGVLVSDGLNVVKTASDGSFTLPGHERAKFVFITTPSGYKTYNSYYISVDSEMFEFGLIPYDAHVAQNGSHSFAHISDTEINSSATYAENEAWLQDMRDYASNEGLSFIIHTGDICYVEGLKQHIQLMNTLTMNVPVFYCIGNHDLVKGKYGEALYESLYGPVFYSFEVGHVHYIVTPMLQGDNKPSYTKEDVYRWMKNDLEQIKPGTPIVVFNHDLLTTGDRFVFGINDKESIDLDAHNLKAWLYGHWHVNSIYKHKQAISICTSTPIRGGIDHSASAFRVVRMDGKGDLKSELRYTGIDKSLEIASIDNLQSVILPSGKLPLFVNAYSTSSPVSRVTCRCFVGEKEIVKDQPLQQNTDFNWSAAVSLPYSYAGQLMTVKVTATFRDGETVMKERSFIYIRHAPVATPKEDWCNLLGNAAHDCLATDTLPTPLRMSWMRNAGSNIFMCAPIIYQGAVYAATTDDDMKGTAAILSMNSADGSIRWQYKVRASVCNTMVASDGLILAQDMQGWLYAVDAATGKLAWEKKLSVKAAEPTLRDGIVVENSIVYAGSGKGLCAVEVKSGRELWVNRSWDQGEGCVATHSVHNGILIGSAHWSALHANDARDGKLLWSLSDNGLWHRSSSAVMRGNNLYMLSDHFLLIIDAANGNILFQKELPYNVIVASTPVITDSEIIFGTATDGVVALDKNTYEEKWHFRTGRSMIYTSPYVTRPSASVEASPIVSGETVYIGAADGVLYGLNRKDGKLMWKHTCGAPILATAAVSGNMLVAVDFSGNIYAFAGSSLPK